MKKKLKDLLDYEQPTKYIVETENYSDEYKLPVLTAGKSFVLGYTNETEGVFKGKNEPVIIFDDFTRDTKYVDFDFKVKSSAMKILHKHNKDDSLKYLHYALNNIKYVPFSHKRLWISDFCNMEIDYPSPEIQNTIATELDTIQSAIDNKKQQLSLLDEAVKSEFVEMFGENPVESGKWKVEKLEDISTVQTGGTPSRNHPEYFEGNIPWITTANLGKNELTYEDAMEYISQDAINNSATKIIPANSLFIGIRVGVGKCSINRVDMCSNQDICGLSGFDTTIINLVFLKKVLDSYSDFFENAKRGTTIKGIKSDTIKKLKIFIPELHIQNQFASFVQQIDKSKFVVKQQISDLQELLDSKMQEYFS